MEAGSHTGTDKTLENIHITDGTDNLKSLLNVLLNAEQLSNTVYFQEYSYDILPLYTNTTDLEM